MKNENSIVDVDVDVDMNVDGGEKGVFKFENQFFSLQDIYRVLGFSTTPTDRELEAKIIMYMRKYNGYNSGEDDRRLYNFFDQLYDYLFDTNDNNVDVEIVEGFVSQSDISGSGTGISGSTGSANGGSGTGYGNSGATGSGNGNSGATGSVVQTVNPVSYSKDVLNPILKQTIQRVISIDSRYRNLNNITKLNKGLTTNFTIELSEPLRDVLSLKLYSYQIPFTWYTVNKDFGSNFFIIQGNVPGLIDEYKIEIEPGNYSATTLTDTINKAIKAVALEYTDVSFGNTKLTYNVNTTIATFTIDIQKSYQESQYYLDWVSWESPIDKIDRTVSNTGIKNIPQYLGFDYQTYNLNSIYSVRDVLPIVSSSSIEDTRNTFYYINRSDTSYNHFFKVILYYPDLIQNGSIWYVNSYADISNNTKSIIDTITIYLDLKEGGHSRDEIFKEVQRQLLISPYFSPEGSSLTRHDQKDDKGSFFNLSLVPNRNKYPFLNSYKSVVVFPNETNGVIKTGFFPIWTGNNSCFCFDSSFVELSDVVAEFPLFPANYIIQGKPYIQFTVNTPGYKSIVIKTNVNKSTSSGYTYENYILEINSAFSDVNRILVNDISINHITYGALTINNKNPFYFDSVSSLPKFTFDFNYTFQKNDYDSIEFLNGLSINSTPFVLLTTNDHYAGVDNSTHTHTVFDFTYFNNGISFDLSYNFPLTSSVNFVIQENQKLFIIRAKDSNYIRDFEIEFVSSKPYKQADNRYEYSDFYDFINDLSKSIRQYRTPSDSSYPLGNSDVITSVVLDNNESKYKIQINIVIQKNISQKDCTVQLYDLASNNVIYYYDNVGFYSPGVPHSSWRTYLNFTNDSYDLSSNSTISGTEPITASTLINLTDSNRYFYLRPQGYSKGLTTNVSGSYINSNYNDLFFSFNKGNYSINTLFDAINVAFSNNEFTKGTNIRYVSKGTKNYCVLRTNINRKFYSKDYALNFYDLTSFVKCYIGSSARNTTWDSTIGWILGFHENTVYDLSSYDYIGTTNSINIAGELSVNTNLFSYFLISVDDFNQNRLNDGLVTITRPEQKAALPSYSAIANFTSDFNGNMGTSGSSLSSENNLTANQVYSINQVLESRKNTSKIYSQGPFVKDIFGYIPLKLPSTPGDIITEYGGTLQNQDRLYFGPVNIRRLQVQLINDKGTIMDLNGADWSFSFICEQLYQKKMT